MPYEKEETKDCYSSAFVSSSFLLLLLLLLLLLSCTNISLLSLDLEWQNVITIDAVVEYQFDRRGKEEMREREGGRMVVGYTCLE